jgi:hypothetical protein
MSGTDSAFASPARVRYGDAMGVIDKYQFESRGAVGCTNSDYSLQRTSCCQSYAAEDDELSDLYFDPADLSHRVSLLHSPRCPFCGAAQWELIEVQEFAEVPAAWRWACAPKYRLRPVGQPDHLLGVAQRRALR